MGMLGNSGGIGGSGIGGALSAGQEQKARDISAGMQGGRGGERRKKKIKPDPVTPEPEQKLSAQMQAFQKEEELQRMASAKRRRYLARRGL